MNMMPVLPKALDVWSLGVMAFELFTGKSALRMIEGKDKVCHLPSSSRL